MKKTILFIPVCLITFMALDSVTVDKATMERGKKVYTQYCLACHQIDGSGVPGLNPPLEKTPHVLRSQTKLIRMILTGMNTHEEIDEETNSNTMAPLNHLTDQQIADVKSVVRN